MDKKIKILYLTTPPHLSGAEKQLFELASKIDKEEYEVLVCTIQSEKKGILLNKLREAGVATTSLNIDSKFQFVKLFKFYSIIKNYDPDVLQSFLFFDNLIARIFGKIAGVPVIISGQRNVETYRSKLRNIFDKLTLPLADHVVSNSEAGKQILIEREAVPDKKITVIYNGIVVDQIEPQKTVSGGVQKIGFVGRLTRQKGLEYLLQAIKELKNEGAAFVVEIVGDGSERTHLEQVADDLGLDDVISFLGHKPQAWDHMQTFDVLVLPSLWEGFPNVVMEAMASGIPVIATKVGGVPEIIHDEENGFLVPSADVATLAEKIKHVLNMPETDMKRITQNARQVIQEKFSIEKMVQEYEMLYSNLLNKYGQERA